MDNCPEKKNPKKKGKKSYFFTKNLTTGPAIRTYRHTITLQFVHFMVFSAIIGEVFYSPLFLTNFLWCVQNISILSFFFFFFFFLLLRCFNIKFLKQYCCYFAPFPVSVLTLRFYLLFRSFFYFFLPFFTVFCSF